VIWCWSWKNYRKGFEDLGFVGFDVCMKAIIGFEVMGLAVWWFGFSAGGWVEC